MADLPEPGSRWTNDGSVFVTRAVNTKRVLLFGEDDGEQVVVPAWEWPGDFTRVPEAEDDEGGFIPAAIVGGEAGGHHDRLVGQALELGVKVLYHYPGTSARPPSHLPHEVSLVIFLTSHLGHSMYDGMKVLAKKSGTPFVHVQSGGFRPALEAELMKLRTKFGAIFTIAAFVYYEWTGSGYTAKEYRPALEQDSVVVSIVLVLLGLAALAL